MYVNISKVPDIIIWKVRLVISYFIHLDSSSENASLYLQIFVVSFSVERHSHRDSVSVTIFIFCRLEGQVRQNYFVVVDHKVTF